MYTRDDPKWVQAEKVESCGASGYVNVTAYGETFEYCHVEWNDPFLNKSKSDVLVQDSQGNWLRVWFYDSQLNKIGDS